MSTPRAPYVGDPGAFESLVHDLVLEPGTRVLGLDEDWFLAQAPGGYVLVVRLGAESDDTVKGLVGRLAGAGVDVILVGWAGGPGVAQAQSSPIAAAHGVRLFHLGDEGELWPDTPPPGGEWLHPWLRRRVPGPPDWARFWAAVDHHRTTLRAEDDDFRRRLAANSPWASRVLVVVMALVFGLELLARAPDDGPALLVMGALYRPGVLDGEVWRLLTASMLHGSLAHAAMNLLVLWRVGDLLERILGSARFLVVYTAGAIGGSVLSLVFLDGLSVGASGAIWGLMAAQFALSYRPGPLLPEPLRLAMRSSAGQNLMLNLFVSFMPGVDWAAHAGGGITGAATAFLLAISLGGSPDEAAPIRAPGWIRALAVGCGLLLVAALARTLLGGAAALVVAG